MVKSSELFSEAQSVIPGGVNSPVRACKSVGMKYPVFIERGEGSKLYDVEGNEYIDFVSSWGPMILGYGREEVLNILKEVVAKGTSFGAPTEIEVKTAKLITEAFPSMEMVRVVNSGTEATMTAIRLARAYTKRKKIIKFAGCYHGHGVGMLVMAGSGALTLGVPSSPGVPKEIAGQTFIASYNDLKSVKDLFKKWGEDIAGVIIEPVAGNMGVVPGDIEFLKGLQDICRKYGSLFILDEVITGFRVTYGGVQTLYGLEPDITCLGKIIGGGLPVGAYGGPKRIMEQMAPTGPVYQAGTLSGNPLAMWAGYTTLKILKENPGIYEKLDRLGCILEKGINEAAERFGIETWCNRAGSMFTLFFTGEKVTDYNSVLTCDTDKYAKYYKGMLKKGIYLSPSQFEAAFISNAHTQQDIEKTIEAVEKVLMNL